MLPLKLVRLWALFRTFCGLRGYNTAFVVIFGRANVFGRLEGCGASFDLGGTICVVLIWIKVFYFSFIYPDLILYGNFVV